MEAISVLGDDSLVERLVLSISGQGRCSVVVEGPAGSGKTFLAETVAAKCRNKFSPRWARGDRLERQIEERVLVVAGNQPLRRDVADYVADAVDDLGDLLAQDGVPFGRIAHRAVTHALAGGSRRRLSETQQRFLARLLTVNFGKRPLLIVDDLQFWDKHSLIFLRSLLAGELDQHFGRLRKLAVIIIADRERAESVDVPLLNDVIGSAKGEVIRTRHPDPSEYPSVLNALGLEARLPEQEVETLHAMTGGNLALSQLIVDELEISRTAPVANSDPPSGYFVQIIARRLQAADASGALEELVNLLAASGNQITLDEVACALKCTRDAAELQATMASRALNFLSVDEGTLRLSHDALQPVLAALSGQRGAQAHRILLACLQRLRPGDYGRRAAHAEAAGDPQSAATLRLLERLSGLRQGRYVWSKTGPETETSESCFDAAYQAMARMDFSGALDAIESQTSEVRILAWEIDLLRAQILCEMNKDACVSRAIGILEELDEAKDEEPELWGRAKELQVVALSNLRRVDEGKLLEAELRRFYQGRAVYDPDAALALNRIRRRSEAVHDPVVANDRLKKALLFHEPNAPGGLPAYPAEYLATLNNLCANEMLLGRFEAARVHARRLASAEFKFVEFVLRRPEVVWSNILLCELMCGREGKPIAQAFGRLAAGRDLNFVDAMLLEVNLAFALAAADDCQAAQARLSASYATLLAQGESQPYVTHFMASNLAVLCWLNGNDTEVGAYLQAAQTSLLQMDRVEYCAPFLAARQAVLEPVILKPGRDRRLANLDRAVQGKVPRVGASWAFFGRALVATDIQFWADT